MEVTWLKYLEEKCIDYKQKGKILEIFITNKKEKNCRYILPIMKMKITLKPS